MALKRKILFFLFISTSCLFWAIGCATDLDSAAKNTDPFSGLIYLYQGPANHLAPVRHGYCPMYPSCSQYGLAAFKKHGPLMGYFMTCDRLMRCGRDETRYTVRIYENSYPKSYDPVDLNDFWWFRDKRSQNE